MISGEPRASVISGDKMQQGRQALTFWRAQTGVVSRLETQGRMAATHSLESRGQPSSAGSKRSDAPQPLTFWRAEDGGRQQARNAARHRSHSRTGEPRTAVVSRLETQRGTAATHSLESRGRPSSGQSI